MKKFVVFLLILILSIPLAYLSGCKKTSASIGDAKATDQGFDKQQSGQRWDPRNYEIPDDHLNKIKPDVFSLDNLEKKLVGYTGFEQESPGAQPYTSTTNGYTLTRSYGAENSAVIVNDVSYAGNQSLKLQFPHSDGDVRPTVSVRFAIPDAQIGHWYAVEFMAKTANGTYNTTSLNRSSAMVILNPRSGSTAQSGQNRGGNDVRWELTSDESDWRKIFAFVQIANDNVDAIGATFYLQIPNFSYLTAGELYLDELKFYHIAMPPLKTVLLTPSYKGLMYGEGSIGDINMEAFIDDGGLYDMSRMWFTSTITDTDYNPIISTGTDNVTNKMDVSFSSINLPNPPEDEPFTVYYIHNVLKDKQTGKIIQESWETIRKAHANYRPTVYYDEYNNRMMKNNEPYFMKTAFASALTNASFTTWVQEENAAFDSAIVYTPRVVYMGNYYDAPYYQWFPNLRASGVQFFADARLSFSDYLDPLHWGHCGSIPRSILNKAREAGVEPKQEYIRAILEAFARDMADDVVLGGYYLHDESNLMRYGNEFRWNSEILSAADINRPTIAATSKGYAYGYGDAMGTADIINDKAYNIERVIKDNPNRPIATHYGYGSTLTHFRMNTWRAISQGVVGIAWYSHFDTMAIADLELRAQILQGVSDTMAEVAAYEPIVMSTEPAPHFTVAGSKPEWLNITTRRHNGKSYIFATNNTEFPQSAQINIAGGVQTLDFEPLGVILKEITQADYLSPLAELHSIGFASGDKSALVTYGNDGKMTLTAPTQTIQYGTGISKNAKLFINDEQVDQSGTIKLDADGGTLIIRVVSQDGQHSVEKTYAYVVLEPDPNVPFDPDPTDPTEEPEPTDDPDDENKFPATIVAAVGGVVFTGTVAFTTFCFMKSRRRWAA